MSIGSFSLQFAPLLPWPWLATASVIAIGLLAFSFWRRAPAVHGACWRWQRFSAPWRTPPPCRKTATI